MRLLVAALCVVALVALTLDGAGIHRGVTSGVQVRSDNRVAQVVPGSPADRAGLKTGDLVRFDRMSLLERVALAKPVPGQRVPVVIQRGTQLARLSLVPVETGFWDVPNALVLVLALLYAAMALLVAWRAPSGRQRDVIVAILVSLSFAWSAQQIAFSVPSIAMHFAGRVTSDACVAIFLTAGYLFVLWFPPRSTLVLPWLWRIGLPATVCSALGYVAFDLNDMVRVLPFNVHLWSDVLTFAASAAMIVGVLDGVLNGGAAYRTRAIVAGSSLVALSLVNGVFAFSDVTRTSFSWLTHLGLLQWASGFGVSYAVLRHRLLDLNLVISRAAIFSVVSLLLLGIFALVEWTFTGILEQTLGTAFGTGEKTALAAAVALFVGLSARSVHGVVQHRLNRVFFAKRYRALEDLHRFALETDAATSSSALLELTLSSMRRNLDAQFVALYTGTPDTGYVAAGTTAAALPLHFDPNEEVVLRLRRWGEAFVVDNNAAHPLADAYVAPMALRGTLYGFAICGPKIDRTSYLPDERETLDALVHRVGIAYEWLTRPSETSVSR